MGSDRPLFVVALVAVVAGAGSAGFALLDSGGSIGSASAASAKEPIERHRNWTFDEAGWLDIAYNVTPELDADDVRINVTVRWGSPPAGSGRSPSWLCFRFGNATPGVFANASFWYSGCNNRPRDFEWEYGAEYGSHRQGVTVDNPGCRVESCSDGPLRIEVSTEEMESILSYEQFRNRSRDSVMHWTVATGHYAPESIQVDATYRGTTVNVTHGPASDTFTYYREDFRAQRGAWASLPGDDWYYRDNATLATTLEQGPGPTLLHYNPLRPQEWGEETAWYVQPDGWRRAEKSPLVEVSAEDGRWTFGFTHSDGRPAGSDRPVLTGTAFRWAELDG